MQSGKAAIGCQHRCLKVVAQGLRISFVVKFQGTKLGAFRASKAYINSDLPGGPSGRMLRLRTSPLGRVAAST